MVISTVNGTHAMHWGTCRRFLVCGSILITVLIIERNVKPTDVVTAHKCSLEFLIHQAFQEHKVWVPIASWGALVRRAGALDMHACM